MFTLKNLARKGLRHLGQNKISCHFVDNIKLIFFFENFYFDTNVTEICSPVSN